MGALGTIVKMLAVLGLLALTLWWLRRHDRGALRSARHNGERPVQLLGQARLGKGASVAVVRIGGNAFAVGVTDRQVQLLSPEPVELPEPAEDTATGAHVASPVPSGLGGLGQRVGSVLSQASAAFGRQPTVRYLEVAPSRPAPTPTPSRSAARHTPRPPADGSAGPPARKPHQPVRS